MVSWKPYMPTYQSCQSSPVVPPEPSAGSKSSRPEPDGHNDETQEDEDIAARFEAGAAILGGRRRSHGNNGGVDFGLR